MGQKIKICIESNGPDEEGSVILGGVVEDPYNAVTPDFFLFIQLLIKWLISVLERK